MSTNFYEHNTVQLIRYQILLRINIVVSIQNYKIVCMDKRDLHRYPHIRK